MTKKAQTFHIWKGHVTRSKKGKNLIKSHLTRTKKDAYISNELQLQNDSLTFIQKIKSLLSATSILYRSPMAYNTTASLEKLTCTDYVDFSKCQDRFRRFFWTKNDSIYLDINLKVFKRQDKNAELRLRQNFSMGEADFSQLIGQRNQLVVAADNKICLQFFNLHCPKTWRSN